MKCEEKLMLSTLRLGVSLVKSKKSDHLFGINKLFIPIYTKHISTILIAVRIKPGRKNKFVIFSWWMIDFRFASAAFHVISTVPFLAANYITHH